MQATVPGRRMRISTVSKALEQEAESNVTDLGDTVSGESGELRAERKWRVVYHRRPGRRPH